MTIITCPGSSSSDWHQFAINLELNKEEWNIRRWRMVPDLSSAAIFTNTVILLYCIVITIFIKSRNLVSTQNREIWRLCLVKKDTSKEKNMRLEETHRRTWDWRKLTNFNELQQDRNQIKNGSVSEGFFFFFRFYY